MLSAFYDVLGPVKQEGAWFQVRIEKRKTIVSKDGAWCVTMGSIFAGLAIIGSMVQEPVIIGLGLVPGVFIFILFLQFLLYKQRDQLLTVSPADGILILEEIIDDETTKILEQIELQNLVDIKMTIDRGRDRYDAHYHLRLVLPDKVITLISSPDRKSASLLGNLIISAKKKVRT